MNEQDKQDELRERFFNMLLRICKKYHLLYQMHYTVYAHEEDFIKVWERQGKQKMIIHIREKGEDKAAECYRKGIDELTYYQKQREKETTATKQDADVAV